MKCLVEKLGVEINNTLSYYGLLESVGDLTPAYMNGGQVIIANGGTTHVHSYAVTAGKTYIITNIGHATYDTNTWNLVVFSTSAIADRVRGTSLVNLQDYTDGFTMEYTPNENGYIFTFDKPI